jgi:site-specific recombinase XerD
MTSALANASAALALLDADVESFARAAKAENTRRAYASDWRLFEAWCAANECESLPASPATIARYISALAARGRKPSTIQRALTSISQAHLLKGCASPTTSVHVAQVVQGVRRVLGVAQRGKAPIAIELLKEMVAGCDGDSLRGLRDRALLLLGFGGAFRRAELVALDVEDVRFQRRGLEVHLRRSKTDQEGAGRTVGVLAGVNEKTCPASALRAWIDGAGLERGPLFRQVHRSGRALGRLTDRSVALIVKTAAGRVGVAADELERLAGHSLRAGFVTAAVRAGKSERAVMAISGHRSSATLRRYVRDLGLFEQHAGEGLGL